MYVIFNFFLQFISSSFDIITMVAGSLSFLLKLIMTAIFPLCSSLKIHSVCLYCSPLRKLGKFSCTFEFSDAVEMQIF